MTTVVYLDDRRPLRAPARPVPVTTYLRDLSDKTRELSDDWLFQTVGEEGKRRLLAERGLLVTEPALA